MFVFFLEGDGVWTEGRCSWQREEHAGKAWASRVVVNQETRQRSV